MAQRILDPCGWDKAVEGRGYTFLALWPGLDSQISLCYSFTSVKSYFLNQMMCRSQILWKLDYQELLLCTDHRGYRWMNINTAFIFLYLLIEIHVNLLHFWTRFAYQKIPQKDFDMSISPYRNLEKKKIRIKNNYVICIYIRVGLFLQITPWFLS